LNWLRKVLAESILRRADGSIGTSPEYTIWGPTWRLFMRLCFLGK
jgi:hypothetical protein